MPTGISGCVLVAIVDPPPLKGLDRRYQLRLGSVMQAYRKLTLHSERAVGIGGANCTELARSGSAKVYRFASGSSFRSPTLAIFKVMSVCVIGFLAERKSAGRGLLGSRRWRPDPRGWKVK